MEYLPIPDLYRVTNNPLIPSINTIWVSDNGNIVKVVKIFSKKTSVIICYRSIDGEEVSISLHKFYSLFSSLETL